MAADSLTLNRSERLAVAAIGTLSLISAALEAGALVTIAAVATSLASSSVSVNAPFLGDAGLMLSHRTAVAVAAALTVLSTAVRLFASHIRAGLVSRWELRQRKELLRRFLLADWPVQQTERVGGVVELLGRLIIEASVGLLGVINLVQGVSSVIVLAIVALVIDPPAAVAMILLGLVVLSILIPLTRRVRTLSRHTALVSSRQAKAVGDLVGLARDLHLAGTTTAAADRIDHNFDATAEARMKNLSLSSSLPVIYQGSALLLISALLLVVDIAPSGDLVGLASAAFLLLRSVNYGQQAQTGYQRFVEANAYREQLSAADRQLSRRLILEGPRHLDQLTCLELRSVTYRYAEEEQPALAGLTVAFSIGEVVGVVGPSGGGKSTLAQLLVRLRDPTNGQVVADNVSATEFDLASWYRQMALVPQVPTLFNGSLYDNIALFRSDVGPEDVKRAASFAGLDDAISNLPDGYDTEIGPEIRSLSGGQVQRIGIARALVGKPTVIVFDEPTSALDVDAETIITNTINSLSLQRDKLQIVIAHRLSTLRHCDRILVLEDGRITGDGTMDDLIESNDYLKSAWERGSLNVVNP